MASAATLPTAKETHEVRMGVSFRNSAAAHHILRYSFKPSHVDWKQRGQLTHRGEGVELRMPKAEGSGSVVFHGKGAQAKASGCLLVCINGKWTIERVRSNYLNLKAERDDPKKHSASTRAPVPVAAAQETTPATDEDAPTEQGSVEDTAAPGGDNEVCEEDLFGSDE